MLSAPHLASSTSSTALTAYAAVRCRFSLALALFSSFSYARKDCSALCNCSSHFKFSVRKSAETFLDFSNSAFNAVSLSVKLLKAFSLLPDRRSSLSKSCSNRVNSFSVTVNVFAKAADGVQHSSDSGKTNAKLRRRNLLHI